MAPRNVVNLTGAGISAESGVPTFRDAGGLWEGHRFEDVATPEAFARDPETVQRFYDLRRAALPSVHPNTAHRALAELAARWPGRLTLVTQNVDDLHDRAQAEVPPAKGFRLIHMHGELAKARCTASGTVVDWPGDMAPHEPSRHHQSGRMRPHIVWFGEVPLEMDAIEAALATCGLFVSIGTSGAVWPAAGFVRAARAAGARTLEINLDPSMGTPLFDEARHGPASVEVPKWVAGLLSPPPAARA
ncbi:MAG: NAD-dependent deacylase [Alphaproteobacteria bacterium]|nr:NAD-dependent deacylase [Alphaproteobacteria bacterium]MBU1526920.1 NAD-dependent deacylase [Alphaproteobacteria bacterium]MBU2118556.1 NAD-dependent deacylase [Alphaproteobacteria bacterium]MBU2352510.1 NAD-dependent deacylase [Alphaproteobacteria bacterium]MBU2382012.1 NAD-dependent deacylase [Alphaproteobacteria bacterium]